jgi:hypothetical protein
MGLWLSRRRMRPNTMLSPDGCQPQNEPGTTGCYGISAPSRSSRLDRIPGVTLWHAVALALGADSQAEHRGGIWEVEAIQGIAAALGTISS